MNFFPPLSNIPVYPMDRFDLNMNRTTMELLLERELRALRGLSRSEVGSLLRNGMRGNIRYRLRTLRRLPPDAQFRLALAFCALEDAETTKFSQRIHVLGSKQDGGSYVEFFARAGGYVPVKRDASSLPLLPDDVDTLANDLTVLTEQMSRGSGTAQKRAKQIARDLLAWRNGHGIKHSEIYERPLSLQRSMFNTRLMQELRLAGQTPRSLQVALADDKVDVHKIIYDVFSPYPSSALRDIDTANVCLSLLPMEVSQRLALEYWKTIRRTSTRRMVHRLNRPDRIAAEARRQGTMKSLRATVEMFLRSIGLGDHESPNRLHEDSFEDLVGRLGVKPTRRFWNCLLACRDKFHGCISIVELQKRRARN